MHHVCVLMLRINYILRIFSIISCGHWLGGKVLPVTISFCYSFCYTLFVLVMIHPAKFSCNLICERSWCTNITMQFTLMLIVILGPNFFKCITLTSWDHYIDRYFFQMAQNEKIKSYIDGMVGTQCTIDYCTVELFQFLHHNILVSDLWVDVRTYLVNVYVH